MVKQFLIEDTICAVSTPPGVGGISLIRVSGSKAVEIAKHCCNFLPSDLESHKAYHGWFRDPTDFITIDEVVLLFFAKGRSYTGEETVEISCHGSPYICNEILRCLSVSGGRPAGKGEFSYRAFINGQIDLVQAESVASLIAGQNRGASSVALRQLKGELSETLRSAQKKVLSLIANIEVGIDFSTEDIEIISKKELILRIDNIKIVLDSLLEGYRIGRILRDGLEIAIVGSPNVGKSSLFNVFAGEELAIVTDIPGTTRDIVRGERVFGNLKINFLDTAGLRDDAVDVVERIGIKKSLNALADADVVFLVFSADKGLGEGDFEIFDKLQNKTIFIVGNKCDLIDKEVAEIDSLEFIDKERLLKNSTNKIKSFYLSSFDKKSVEVISRALEVESGTACISEYAVISSARQFEGIKNASNLMDSVKVEAESGVGAEYLAVGLKTVLEGLSEVLGEKNDEAILDAVFGEFCIGK